MIFTILNHKRASRHVMLDPERSIRVYYHVGLSTLRDRKKALPLFIGKSIGVEEAV